MNRKGLLSIPITLFAAFALVLQGCASSPSPAPMPPASIPPSAFAPAIAAPTPLPTPTKTVAPAASPFETPASTPSPAPAPTPDSKYIANKYSASDGTHVYYFSNDGVHRMDMDGGNDTVTGISQCYDFLSIDADGLYYLAYDDDYTPTGTEQSWGGFNLMFCDAKTGNSTTLMPHVLDACAFSSSIYAVDYLKHSHIVRYDTVGKSFTEVTGFPPVYNDEDDVRVFSDQGTSGRLLLSCDSGLFTISGDSIGAPPTGEPDDGINEDPGYLKWSTDFGTVSIKTGSGYKQLLTNVYDMIRYNSKYYVRVFDFTADTRAATLYEVSPDGTVKKLAGPVMTKLDGSDMKYIEAFLFVDEIAGGWYFTFQTEGRTACAMLMKVKVG